ncbi:MAG: cob(I)yrinic acid a,c-diamide adenosyltransferase [Gemmatimonadaceae bacterium]
MAKKVRIYTGIGDSGSTRLFGGGTTSKGSLRVEAYGLVDELSSTLGLALPAVRGPRAAERLQEIQNDLFDVGGDLATPMGEAVRSRLPRLIGEEDARKLEGWIDAYEEDLPPIGGFILPGGSEAAARVHVARSCCRSAERAIVRLAAEEEVRPELLVYMNRLADFLFVLARIENQVAGAAEILWQQRRDAGG